MLRTDPGRIDGIGVPSGGGRGKTRAKGSMRLREGTRWMDGEGGFELDPDDEASVAAAALAAARVSGEKMDEGVVGDGTERKDAWCCCCGLSSF